MIERYSRPEMSAIWTDKNKFSLFLQIELLNAEAYVQKGVTRPEELKTLQEKATFSLSRIAELEAETKHDVIAFTRTVSESLGAEKRFIHYGLTSTDVVDTANGVMLKQANAILRKDLHEIMAVLRKRAFQYQDTFCIGRTHGMHADLTVFGLKWALWYAEMARNLTRFEASAREVECGKISGAVGNYAFTDPDIETFVCDRLGIDHAKISTQVLQRDRHAYYIATLALIGATLEKIATEIRNLQRTEIGEVAEPFAITQKGSSAMPHKHNPIACENICGLARILRGYMIPAYEDITLWHERDISHSSVERIMLPDATILLDYMIHRFTGVLSGLLVYPEQMRLNIQITRGIIFSQRVLTALIDCGFAREEAYDLVQQLANQATEQNIDFSALVKENPIINGRMTKTEIADLFDMNFYKKQVRFIYQRVFTEES
jgi:adenylosuccinate lyase